MGGSPTISRRRLLQASGVGVAALALPTLPAALAAPTGRAVALAGDPLDAGYWIAMANGRVLPRGSARGEGRADAFDGEATAVAAYPTGHGFWRVRGNGKVSAFGAASLEPDAMHDRRGGVVGLAAHPSGEGLWRVTSKGQINARGASAHLGAPHSDAPIVGIAAHPEQSGYWVLNRNGRVFAFGASRNMGSPFGRVAAGIAAHPSGDGYWVVKRNGDVGAYGVSGHHGDANLDSPIVDITAAPDGGGYWLLARDGRVRAFGSAKDGVISTSPPPQPEITTVGGIVVATSIARRVKALLGHAKDDGINLGGWGYRDHLRQIELREQNCGPRYYDVYVKSSSECSPMTAIPGRSMHERGLAIDFYRERSDGSTTAIAGTRAFKWMSRHAKSYGLFNLPSEPWHWSTTGG